MHIGTDRVHALRCVFVLHHSQSRECRGRTDPFGPEGARDETRLCGLHHLGAADDGRDGVAVAQGLAEGCDVGLDAVMQMQATEGAAESRGALIEDEYGLVLRGQCAHTLKEPRIGRRGALHLHVDDADLWIVGQDVFKLLKIVVLERDARTAQLARNTVGFQAGDEVTVQRIVVTEIRGEIPVMPTVVPAERDVILARCCSPNAHRNCTRLAA